MKPRPTVLALTLTLAMGGCGKMAADKSGEASLEDLNQAIAVMSMGGRHPTNVYELTNFPSLRGKSLPQPPTGKRLVIDSQSRTVVFVAE